MPLLPSAASLRSALFRVVPGASHALGFIRALAFGLILLAYGGLQTAAAATPADPAAPRVLFTAATLAELQARLAAGDPRVVAYHQALEKAALVWREGVSQAPDEFHVPLFYHDRTGHRAQKSRILTDATAAYGLALRYRLGGDESDAEHATRYLRPWFRAVSYRKGADTELVFCYTFPLMIYAADLLRTSASWVPEDRAEFDAFLTTTALPLHTAGRPNNHGSWGNLLRIAIAAYRDDATLLATSVLRHQRFIEMQIGKDAEFTEEVGRNGGVGDAGIGYSHFTLGPLAVTALIAENRGIELFNYVAPNGRTMEAAWRRLVPWTADPATFPYFKGKDVAKISAVTTIDYDYFDTAKTGLVAIRMGYFDLLQARWPVPAAATIIERLGPGALDSAAMQWLGLTHGTPLPPAATPPTPSATPPAPATP